MCHKKVWFQGRDTSDLSRDSAAALSKSLSFGEWGLLEQVQDYEKTLRPALLTARTRLLKTENEASLCHSQHLAGQVQWGQGTDLSMRLLNQKWARQATNVPLCLRTAPCSLTRELVNPPRGPERSWPRRVPALPLPACSGNECSSHSGGSRGSTRCSRPGGWSAWSHAAGSYHVSCACCNAESRPVY